MKTYDRGLVARAGRDRRRPVRLKVWVYVAFSPSKLGGEEFVSSGFYLFRKV